MNGYIGFEGELPENVYCSAEADEEQIIIKLVNANAEEIEADFGLTGTAKVFRLHQDDLAARNDLAFTGTADYHVQIEEREEDLASYRCPGQTLDVLVIRR